MFIIVVMTVVAVAVVVIICVPVGYDKYVIRMWRNACGRCWIAAIQYYIINLYGSKKVLVGMVRVWSVVPM